MAKPLTLSFLGEFPQPLQRQTVGNSTIECVPSATDTSLADCNALNDILVRCNTLANESAPKQDIIDCFCTQEVLSAYVGCKNDARLCTLSYSYDSDFDKMISDWTDNCTPHLTTAITTPAGVTLTETFDEPTCQALFVSCNKLASTYSSCSSAFTQATDLYSCRCASDVLSLASECQINGDLQCNRITPDPRTLWAARYCSITPSIPDRTPVASTVLPVTTAGIFPSVSFGPESTMSSTTSQGSTSLKLLGPHMLLVCSVMVTLAAK